MDFHPGRAFENGADKQVLMFYVHKITTAGRHGETKLIKIYRISIRCGRSMTIKSIRDNVGTNIEKRGE